MSWRGEWCKSTGGWQPAAAAAGAAEHVRAAWMTSLDWSLTRLQGAELRPRRGQSCVLLLLLVQARPLMPSPHPPTRPPCIHHPCSTDFEGFSSDETVRVVMSGNQEPRSVDITQEALDQGVERLNQLVVEAMRESHGKSVEVRCLVGTRLCTLPGDAGLSCWGGCRCPTGWLGGFPAWVFSH